METKMDLNNNYYSNFLDQWGCKMSEDINIIDFIDIII